MTAKTTLFIFVLLAFSACSYSCGHLDGYTKGLADNWAQWKDACSKGRL